MERAIAVIYTVETRESGTIAVRKHFSCARRAIVQCVGVSLKSDLLHA